MPECLLSSFSDGSPNQGHFGQRVPAGRISGGLGSSSLNALVAWFARNRVAANLLMCLIVFGGVLGLMGLRKQVFPTSSPRR